MVGKRRSSWGYHSRFWRKNPGNPGVEPGGLGAKKEIFGFKAVNFSPPLDFAPAMDYDKHNSIGFEKGAVQHGASGSGIWPILSLPGLGKRWLFVLPFSDRDQGSVNRAKGRFWK